MRRSESLLEKKITHVLSMVAFNPASLKNFKDEPWTDYGKELKQMVIDLDDVDDENILIELPRAVKFIDEGLRVGRSVVEEASAGGLEDGVKSLSLSSDKKGGAVFVHCAAGKSRSVSVIVAYLLWRYPNRFDPNYISPSIPNSATTSTISSQRPRRETASEAVQAAVTYIRRTRPMAEPNDGFMKQLELWWEMGCPVEKDIEQYPLYQRWAYQREVAEHLAVNEAPSRLRFEDEHMDRNHDTSGLSLRCKKCSRTLVTAPYIVPHKDRVGETATHCQHFFIEPLSWMREELEKGTLNGRLLCPTARCGAAVGRYDWKGYRCSCGGWVCPAFSLQRARVDDVVIRTGDDAQKRSLGIRMPPGKGNL